MISNKQIEGMLKGTAQNLKELLENKDEIMNSAKEKLSPSELKSFTALELMVNKQIKNGDYNGAFKTISKYRQNIETKK